MNNKITSNKISSDEVEINLKGFFRVLKKNIRSFISASLAVDLFWQIGRKGDVNVPNYF